MLSLNGKNLRSNQFYEARAQVKELTDKMTRQQEKINI